MEAHLQAKEACVTEVTRSPQELIKAKQEELAAEEAKLRLIEGLPHLHGRKWYKWAWDFFESRNNMNLLTAGNQLSKSSSAIRKCIHWATAVELWDELWPDHKPKQFWYFYPTASQATIEFEEKWDEFLPKNEYKDHPVYGWRSEKKNKEIFAIYFNSGVTVYFKSYAQGLEALQTGTVDAMFCDEECPVDLYGELTFRLSASDGYFHAVFTATMGQEFWRLVMEPQEHEEEKLPQAFKQQVSAYDCQVYMDGSKSHWTDAKINQVIAKCADHDEVLRRVWGRFIRNKSGRKFEQFDIKRHMKAAHPIPRSWLIYAAADVGSGGEEGHPAAICFVAVAPDFKQGRVFLGWRGDGTTTTAGDVVDKFIEIKKENSLVLSGQYYDWASADFYNIATSLNEPFEKANKGHEGYDTLNTLFKNDMLFIYDTPELRKLATELSGLRKETRKTKAIDDFCDALRYACASIPWDWSAITGAKPVGDPAPDPKEPELTPMQIEINERRAAFMEPSQGLGHEIEQEFSEWNELYS